MRWTGAGRGLRNGLLVLVCLWGGLPLAGAKGLEFSLQRLELNQVRLEDFRLALSGGNGPGVLSAGLLEIGGARFEKLQVVCPAMRLQAQVLECAEGRWSTAKSRDHRVSMNLDLARKTLLLRFGQDGSEVWRMGQSADGGVELDLVQAHIERFDVIPHLMDWAARGTLSGKVRFFKQKGEPQLEAELNLQGGAFTDPAGNQAGEHLAAHFEVAARRQGERWQWRFAGDWQDGDLFFAPLSLRKGGLHIEGDGQWQANRLTARHLGLRYQQMGAVHVDLEFDTAKRQLVALHGRGEQLDLGQLGDTFLSPFLEHAAKPPARFAGKLDLELAWQSGILTQLNVQTRDTQLAFGGVQLSGLSLDIPWRLDGKSEARLSTAGARLGPVVVAPFHTTLYMDGLKFSLPKWEIPLLDGSVMIEDGRLEKKDGEWQGEVSGVLNALSLSALAQQMGWPAMEGSIAGSIPSIEMRGREVVLNGDIVVPVFEGYIMAKGLSLYDPLRKTKVIRAKELQLRHLDLSKITRIAEFGEISGFVDADVKDAEFIDGHLQGMYARLETSSGDFPRHVSLRAVEHIASLSGDGAGVAIQRSLLRYFQNFSYDRIGLSCRLRNGVCQMDGVGEAQDGYVIMKGAGTPSVNIVGYNRKMDWELLLNRIQQAVKGTAKPVFDQADIQ